MSTEQHLTSSDGLIANNELTRFPTPFPLPHPVPIVPIPAVVAQGAINAKYNDLGGAAGFLGHAVTGLGTIASSPNGSGYFVHYQGGSIYWSSQTGAHEVHGLIRGKWSALGWERSALGYPTTDETSTPDRIGRYNHFEGGSIYWTPSTGAHEVHGLIRGKWSALGWERSALGYPTTDETPTPAGGRYNLFQGGAILWKQGASQAFETHGAIRGKHGDYGFENGFLGFPVTDETPTPDGIGRYNHFEGGSIYWTPTTGAHEVHGLIRAKWAALGWEQSFLGYPTSDEASTPDGRGRISYFQNGTITWTGAAGAVEAPYTRKWHADITFSDSTPLGGWVDFVADNRGAFTFSGHMHDSGFDPISFTIAVAIITPTGMGYGFGFSGKCGGTISRGSRDSDWMGTLTSTFKDQNGNVVPNPNPAIAADWSQIAQGQMAWTITSQDLTAQGIVDFVVQQVQKLADQAAAAGIAKLIALIAA